jgi:hypothetical protein
MLIFSNFALQRRKMEVRRWKTEVQKPMALLRSSDFGLRSSDLRLTLNNLITLTAKDGLQFP